MSIEVNLVTPQKKEIAEVLRAVARMIESSSNETVTVDMTVKFNLKRLEAEKDES